MSIPALGTSIEIVNLKTRPIPTFSIVVQVAYAVICQHIDWLFQQVSPHAHDLQHRGSDSWVKGTSPDTNYVLVKALPWDQRIPRLAQLASYCREGVAILVRNDVLTARDMQAIWEEYGNAFFCCPTHPALYTVMPRFEAHFQLLLFCLAKPGCDLLKLPGVEIDKILPELRSRRELGPDDEVDEDWPDGLPVEDPDDDRIGEAVGKIRRISGETVRPVSHERMAEVLRGILKRLG